MKRSLKEMRSLLELHRYPGAEGHSLEFLAAAPEIVADLLATVQELREALEEFSKPPYKDSDLLSWMEWVNSRANAVLKQLDAAGGGDAGGSDG